MQGSGVREALAGPVAVVEAFEVVERMQQMLLVPDQGSVEEFAAAGPDPAFHDRVRAGCLDATEHDLDARIGEHGVEQRGDLAVPVADVVPGGGSDVIEAMTRFRAACATREAVGWAVAPTIRIRRVACSITATYIRAPLTVTVSKKSRASRASACERRKSAQVLDDRSGAGSTPASRRISQTVDGATFTPSTSSSPCRRR